MGSSIFDPFYEEIKDRVEMNGQPMHEAFREMFSEMEGYSLNNFIYFCRTRNIKSGYRNKMELDKCSACERYGELKPYYTGRCNVRYCKEANRLIKKNQVICPLWCPKKGDIKYESKG